ncbi:Maf family protein [Natranaerobius thermophilus]|uniref:dTTP/UTP pyrophosphatase n=1 Tax=Natranaerobius thermophilus (strain ATCC BAA-1301 / DSM 18059 / JW/NM-WN-LF) TaxID=457570 RepID=B2A698_NATTJ|nr:Maf family protein [Natranaerobius thermophilus]ACB84109.1 maf protein [Natranaerobius thermophilus JW/NM-WN-LF]
MTNLCLASASPRRKELLQQLNLDFTVCPSNINEDKFYQLPIEKRAVELAKAKANDVANKQSEGLVIGADTMVVFGNRILEKPRSETDAKEMLSTLSGNKHKVITGVALVNASDKIILTDRGITDVWFRNVKAFEIENYIATGEPMDKAGAYGIQGYGSLFVDKIYGCYYNVVGLPLSVLAKMLEAFGVQVLK